MTDCCIAFAGVDLDALIEAIKASSAYPWTQGWLTAVATIFGENIICWTIVPPLLSEGIMGYMTAFQATFWGVFLGDIVTYLPPRFAMRYAARSRWIRKHQDQIEACSHFFDRHIGKTMFIIRFTPGIRTPAILAAGMLRVDFRLYCLYSALSSILQSLIACFFMPTLYAPAIAWLKGLWDGHRLLVVLIVLAFFAVFGVIQWFAARAVMRRLTAKKADKPNPSPTTARGTVASRRGRRCAKLKGMRTTAPLLLALLAAPLLPAADAPTRIIVSPLCAATESWNQDDKMNEYLGAPYCGCDPLAWGQIAVYHALNHGIPSGTWKPPAVSGEVTVNGKKVTRSSKYQEEPYDWAAVRDRVEVKRPNGEQENPVARLMYDFGILGGANYTDDGTMATVNEDRFREYFNFAEGYRYMRPSVHWNMPEGFDWDDMLHRILRVSLQVGAPLGAGIYTTTGYADPGHMIVVDGWGVDENGTDYFHVNYGWGGSSNGWWDWSRVSADVTNNRGFRHFYASVFPTALGSVIVGRVSDAEYAPIAGATVKLTAEDGTVWTTRTDAEGCYVFKNLPLVDTKNLYPPTDLPTDAYTVEVSAAGYAAQSATVTVEGYIDDDLRGTKADQWENENKGDGKGEEAPIVYPITYGGSVADFVLEPVAKTVVDSVAELESLPDGKTIYVATGTYALTQPLTIPANTTLIGGYNPKTGVVDPLATPTRLEMAISTLGSQGIVLGKGAELNGFALVGNKNVPVIVQAADGAGKPTVRNCVFVSQPTWGMSGIATVAQGVALTTCLFFDITGARLDNCTISHCTFVGALLESTDVGGNLAEVATRRPTKPNYCEAGHECPEFGLDGRPLGGHLGALAPDSFEFTPETLKALGYRLRLK